MAITNTLGSWEYPIGSGIQRNFYQACITVSSTNGAFTVLPTLTSAAFVCTKLGLIQGDGTLGTCRGYLRTATVLAFYCGSDDLYHQISVPIRATASADTVTVSGSGNGLQVNCTIYAIGYYD